MLKWTVEIAIADNWIADGFRVTEENIHEAIIGELLQYAYEEEVVVRVLTAPTDEQISAVENTETERGA